MIRWERLLEMHEEAHAEEGFGLDGVVAYHLDTYRRAENPSPEGLQRHLAAEHLLPPSHPLERLLRDHTKRCPTCSEFAGPLVSVHQLRRAPRLPGLCDEGRRVHEAWLLNVRKEKP